MTRVALAGSPRGSDCRSCAHVLRWCWCPCDDQSATRARAACRDPRRPGPRRRRSADPPCSSDDIVEERLDVVVASWAGPGAGEIVHPLPRREVGVRLDLEPLEFARPGRRSRRRVRDWRRGQDGAVRRAWRELRQPDARTPSRVRLAHEASPAPRMPANGSASCREPRGSRYSSRRLGAP